MKRLQEPCSKSSRKRSERVYIPPVYSSWILAALGEIDAGIETLERAFEDRNAFLVFPETPGYDALRSDRRFVDLVRRMGLEHLV